MSIKFLSSDIRILNMSTRMPFKYGIATLTRLPHLFLKIDFEIKGIKASGISSEGLAPKWFTKNPHTSFEEDIQEMISVIQHALKLTKKIGSAECVFSFWRRIYDEQSKWGRNNSIPPLLTSFGVSMVERAMISAFCKASQMPFHLSVKELGFKLSEIYPELDDSLLDKTLPEIPQDELEIRHTVGLADYLNEDEIPDGEKVSDGLAQSLEQNIKDYGIKKLKIKLFGNLEKDLKRLSQISAVMEAYGQDYSFSLDGNEYFTSAEDFKKYWQELESLDKLKTFLRKLLFIEQPIHREFALNDETGRCFSTWKKRPLMIIDESDGELHSAKRALELGYSGTSHKNCKGVFKSIANACLVKSFSGILSAEDLCNVGPVALLEDLAVVSALGISHAERNGHQYMRGLSMFPNRIQKLVLNSHKDLYKSFDNFPALKIVKGKVSLKSVNKAPFGFNADLDCSSFTALKDWHFSSLNSSH